MKKISLLFLLLVFPVCVFAKDTCDPSNIKIESITLEDTKGNIEEFKEASSDSQKINLGLRMNVVGDTASYKIVLKNNSNEDYYFDEKSLNLDTDYIDYEVNYEDGNNLMKGGEEKVLFLKVVYKEKMDSSTLENGLYQDTQVVKLNLTNNNLVDEILENPLTGRKLGLLIFIFLIVGCILFYKEKKKSAYMFFLVVLILPFGVQALCRHSLEIKNYLVIDAREAVFLTGKEVNVKMKQLAGDDTSISSTPSSVQNESITAILKSEIEPSDENKEEKNIVSTTDSPYPIYMWFDNGTIYWWSEDDTPALNEDSSYMFYRLRQLTDISGIDTFDCSNSQNLSYVFSRLISLSDITSLSKWNTSNVTNMQGLFLNDSNIESLSGIENWDTSNVKDMSLIFDLCKKLNDVSAIKNWNVTKVETLYYSFASCYLLEEVDLSNWKTKSLTDISFMFSMLFNSSYDSGTLKRIILSEKFDTSKVTTMENTFYNNPMIEDYSFLQYFDTSNVTDLTHIFFNNLSFDDIKYVKDWDVSNVTNMNGTFIGTESLTSLEGLENWDVSNVEDMSFMFRNCISLKSLNEIKDWNVSKVLNYKYMFYGCRILQDVSSINDWNISKNADFTRMFAGVPVLPEFSKVNGTWSSGSFIPSS